MAIQFYGFLKKVFGGVVSGVLNLMIFECPEVEKLFLFVWRVDLDRNSEGF